MVDDMEMPHGYTLGFAGAVVDEINYFEDVRQDLRRREGITDDVLVERASRGEDIEDDIDRALGPDKKVQRRMERQGFRDRAKEYFHFGP